ncbi:MAG: hypothetical protein IH597_09815 [Bacteroidales bacterium]|nr:hypothetical protein [Bacteroidales bacterium]
MKKKITLLFSFIALVAFITVNAQSPKTDKKSVKVEQTVEKKASEPCCETKGHTTAAKEAKSGCCTSGSDVKAETTGGEAKAGCATAGKTCGGCSSKTSTQSAESVPVPKR